MNLTKQDLLVPCTRCNGRGRVTTAPAGESGPRDRQETLCPTCHGRGQRLTETGEAIRALLVFLRKHGDLG